MLTTFSNFSACPCSAVHPHPIFIVYRAVCIFIVIALLFVGHGKAQEKIFYFEVKIEDIHSPNICVRRLAIMELGKFRPKTKEAVLALIAALKDQDEIVRDSAAKALRQIMPEAEDAAPALVAALN